MKQGFFWKDKDNQQTHSQTNNNNKKRERERERLNKIRAKKDFTTSIKRSLVGH